MSAVFLILLIGSICFLIISTLIFHFSKRNDDRYSKLQKSYRSLLFPILTLIPTIFLGLYQFDVKTSLERKQTQTLEKFNEIKSRIDSSQLDISRGQIAINLIDNIVKGSDKERRVAFQILNATGNQFLARNILLVMASSDDKEIQKQGLDGISQTGLKGAQAFSALKNLSKTEALKSHQNMPLDLTRSALTNTMKIANAFYSQQRWKSAADYYNSIAHNIENIKVDQQVLALANINYDNGNFEQAANKYFEAFSTFLKDE